MSEPVAGEVAADSDEFGVYVHIPFCTKRCDYCAFATWTDRAHLTAAYVDAVVLDVERTRGSIPVATSVFFGGGTPSLLAPEDLGRVLAAVARTDDAEVTVECNPDTVDPEKLAGYRAAGTNRLSFGVQSMVPHVLVALGRTHDPANVEHAVRWARAAGFDNVNLDLIYGAVGESLDDWRTTLERVIALGPDHVSAYGLTVEPGTPLADDPLRHPDDDDQADKYRWASSMLDAAGLAWYEISNFARPGRTCRHNRLYWSQGNYRGFGCAAHSHRDGLRWWNIRTPDRFIEAVRDGRSTEAGRERLDDEARRMEGLQLSVRTAAGVSSQALEVGNGPDQVPADLVEPLPGEPERTRLTMRGRLLANEVALRLR